MPRLRQWRRQRRCQRRRRRPRPWRFRRGGRQRGHPRQLRRWRLRQVRDGRSGWPTSPRPPLLSPRRHRGLWAGPLGHGVALDGQRDQRRRRRSGRQGQSADHRARAEH